MDETIINWLIFQNLPEQNARLAEQLLNCFSTPNNLFQSDNLQGLPSAMQASIRALGKEKQNHALYQKALAECALAEGLNIELIDIESPRYPQLLKETFQPPTLLYVKGNKQLLNSAQLAVVGSRKASASASQIAHDWSCALAKSALSITSGLALGIDGAAHQGALDGGGATIAVLANGLDSCYPKQHRYLADAIIANNGALISEFAFGNPPLRAYFPQRNRIISGMSLAVLVVEAALKSGSLITARLAMEQGREVFAVPGSVNNVMARGCHYLIKQGAQLVENCDDVLQALALPLQFAAGQEAGSDEVSEQVSAQGLQILASMGFDPMHIDEIQQLVAMDSASLAGELLLLELAGKLANQHGYYQKLA